MSEISFRHFHSIQIFFRCNQAYVRRKPCRARWGSSVSLKAGLLRQAHARALAGVERLR